MIHIVNNSVVSIRYIMKNSKYEVLANTMSDDPVNYLHGSSTILPVLQTQLEGLKAGDRKVVYLPAATGLTKEDFIFEVIVDNVRAASKEEILLGYPVTINIAKCEESCVCYD